MTRDPHDVGGWIDAHRKDFAGDIKADEPLSKHTYYQIGGPAAFLLLPTGLADLNWISELIRQTSASYFILGRGSNLLVHDSGFSGVVVKHQKLNEEITPLSDSVLRTGSSVVLSTLLQKAGRNGWGGLEFLTGVPGSVGGAVFMNAGTHLGESGGCLLAVEFFDFSNAKAGVQRLSANSLKYSYRKNHFLRPSQIVWAAEWTVTQQEPTQVVEAIRTVLERRKSTQPIDAPSCGSVFKNPKAHQLHAWQVIEKLGLRGHTIGAAQFSEKHCNFIVNKGKAKAADVKALIDLAKQRARAELSIDLEEEVRYLGF